MHVFSVVSDSATLWIIATRLLCPWDSPGKNPGVGCCSLLQGIFLTQEWNPELWHLLHCRQVLNPLSHLGSPPFIHAREVIPLDDNFIFVYSHLFMFALCQFPSCVCVCMCHTLKFFSILSSISGCLIAGIFSHYRSHHIDRIIIVCSPYYELIFGRPRSWRGIL